MRNTNFCPCTDASCAFHPKNHDHGCDLCVEDSVKNREIPKCFFLKVVSHVDGFEDWSFEKFSELVLKQAMGLTD